MADERPARDAVRRDLRQLGIIAALIIAISGYLVIQQRAVRQDQRDTQRELQCLLARNDGDLGAIIEHCD